MSVSMGTKAGVVKAPASPKPEEKKPKKTKKK